MFASIDTHMPAAPRPHLQREVWLGIYGTERHDLSSICVLSLVQEKCSELLASTAPSLLPLRYPEMP